MKETGNEGQDRTEDNKDKERAETTLKIDSIAPGVM